MSAGHGTKAVVAALFANLGIAIAKFVAFALTRSTSMLAEGVHSLADSGNQGLLLLGAKRARRAADPENPFGHGRQRYFWSFIVALVLFTGGGAFALYEGIEKLRHPHETTSIGIAIGVLIFGIVLEIFSFRTAIVEARPLKGDRTWWRFVRTTRHAELPVVLLEDLGALVGLVLALVGVSLAAITGDPMWDAIGTISIGVLLGVIAVILAIEMKGLLLGEAATEEDVARIKEALAGTPGITHTIHLRTQHLGPEQLLVGAKVALEPGLSVERIAQVIDAAEARIRAGLPGATTVFCYLEPDLYRASTTPPGGGTAAAAPLDEPRH